MPTTLVNLRNESVRSYIFYIASFVTPNLDINPPERYCPSYFCVISTAPRFSAPGGKKEDGGIEPLQLPIPWFSRPVAVHSAASSIEGYQTGLEPALTGSTNQRLDTLASDTISGINGN